MKTRFCALLLICFLYTDVLMAQPIDTNIYATSTASMAATWLKQLQLPAGTGNLAVLAGFGPMDVSFNSRSFIDTYGMTAYYNNAALVQQDMNHAGNRAFKYFTVARKAGIHFMRCPTFLPWGFIETAPGTYHYSFIDTVMHHAGINNISLIGTIIPYNDLSTGCNTPDTMCHLYDGWGDYYFLNNPVTGQVCIADTTAYYNFIMNLVERYDGDGINDMPGLIHPMLYWEVGNEPEGSCGNYDYNGYIKDLSLTSRAIKAACPNCLVLNGGSLGDNDSLFWYHVIDSLKQFIDIANMHDNIGKDDPSFDFTLRFRPQRDIFQKKIDQYSLSCPLFCTEWGLYSGSPNGKPFRSEEQQAALYCKYYCWGRANNLPVYFYDFFGNNTSGIGTSALFEQGQNDSFKARLWAYTSRLYEYKFRDVDSVNQHVFSANYGDGHIRFWKSGKHSDVLWGVNSLPADISGIKNVIDLYGNISTMNVANLTFPLSSNPIIIEDASLGIEMVNDDEMQVYPNPVTDECIIELPGTGFEILIEDMLGQNIVHLKTDKPKTIIDCKELSKGLYFIKAIKEQSVISQKMIKL